MSLDFGVLKTAHWALGNCNGLLFTIQHVIGKESFSPVTEPHFTSTALHIIISSFISSFTQVSDGQTSLLLSDICSDFLSDKELIYSSRFLICCSVINLPHLSDNHSQVCSFFKSQN